MDKLWLTANEAAAVLGVGRSKVYELMADGQPPSVHTGTLRRTGRAAAPWLQETLQAQHNGTLVRESMTVSECFPNYLEKVAAPKVRAATLVNDERRFDNHIEPPLGQSPDKLEPRHLSAPPREARPDHEHLLARPAVAAGWGGSVEEVFIVG